MKLTFFDEQNFSFERPLWTLHGRVEVMVQRSHPEESITTPLDLELLFLHLLLPVNHFILVYNLKCLSTKFPLF